MKNTTTETVDSQLSAYKGVVSYEDVIKLLAMLGDNHLPRTQDRVDYTLYRLILLLLKKIDTLENSCTVPLNLKEEK